jgi:hypothetical protein
MRLLANCASAVTLGCLALATARAEPYRNSLDCGARWDLCMQACDYRFPGGTSPGQCNDHCAVGAGVCEASRIPAPASYRSRHPAGHSRPR